MSIRFPFRYFKTNPEIIRLAALKFLRKSMKRYGQSEIIMTDKLRSYWASTNITGDARRQETGRWLDNRAGNLHLLFRRRERVILRFRQMRNLQKFASVHNHFNQKSHLNSRGNFKFTRSVALTEWRILGAA